MDNYGNQPGGGFSSVDGYNDVAGSQAEEQRRMQEDEMNRQRQEQAANDAAAEQAAFSQPTASGGGAASRRRSRRQPQQRSTPNVKSKTAPTPRPVKQNAVNPGFALLGFILAGLWGMGLLEDDGRWFSGCIVGLIGAYVAGHYHKVLIAASLVGAGWWFFSTHDPSEFLPVATVDPVPRVQPSGPDEVVAVKSEPQTPEQEVEARFPYPAKPSILLREHEDLVTDPSRMRGVQKAMFDFEKRTGKSFLTDHQSMKPATRSRFDYFPQYADGGLEEGRETIPSLEPIQGIWDYRSPQLWELNLMATIEQHFLYKTTYDNGTIREGGFRTYSGDGLCYKPMFRPLRRDAAQHEVFQLPVRGGNVWREFVQSVYHAKTDAELLALDPMNLAITQTQKKIAEATALYESQKRLVDGLRQSNLRLTRAVWRLRSSRR